MIIIEIQLIINLFWQKKNIVSLSLLLDNIGAPPRSNQRAEGTPPLDLSIERATHRRGVPLHFINY